jgi:hypothetical protein
MSVFSVCRSMAAKKSVTWGQSPADVPTTRASRTLAAPQAPRIRRAIACQGLVSADPSRAKYRSSSTDPRKMPEDSSQPGPASGKESSPIEQPTRADSSTPSLSGSGLPDTSAPQLNPTSTKKTCPATLSPGPGRNAASSSPAMKARSPCRTTFKGCWPRQSAKATSPMACSTTSTGCNRPL